MNIGCSLDLSISPSMDDYRSLDKLFPEDPNLPSISYQAHEHSPICIPWTSRPVMLGAGFDSSVVPKTGNNNAAFRPSAFVHIPGEVAYQLDPAENRNSLRQTSSAHQAMSYAHMDFKGTMSAGGSVLGASGRGEFAKNVYNNRDVQYHCSSRCGWILTGISTVK